MEERRKVREDRRKRKRGRRQTDILIGSANVKDFVDQLKELPFLSDLMPQQLIVQVPLFADLNEKQMEKLAASTILHQFLQDEIIIREGEYEESVYIILSGSVRSVTSSEDNNEVFLGLMGKGESFGEMSALTGYPRAATVIAEELTFVLEISKEDILDLMEISPKIKAIMDQQYIDRALNNQISRIPLFADLEPSVVEELCSKAIMKSFKKGEAVFREGDPGDAFYMVRCGFVKISNVVNEEEIVYNYLKGGDFFGEMALLTDRARTMTVSAVTHAELVQILRDDFIDLLQRYPKVMASVQETIEQRKAMDVEVLHNSETVKALKFIIDKGIIQATDILLIDLDKCIRCYNCVKACEDVHEDGYSRVNLKGPKIGSFMIADVCQHCSDPECMFCPIGAIGRDKKGEVYIAEHCVGVGVCAKKCPYGVISIVDLPPEPKKRGRIAERLDMCRKSPSGCKTADEDRLSNKRAKKQKRFAIKCDLCENFPYPACVANCPTGAARRDSAQAFYDELGISIN